LQPYGDADQEQVNKLPEMEQILFVTKRPRNPKLHRKYFAMIKVCFENQDQFNDIDSFRKIYQMRAGYYDPVKTKKGMAYIPLSIGYEALDDAEFGTLYSRVLDELIKDFGYDKEGLEGEIIKFI